ncbi:MAG: peptidylprolyl isomerase [Gemmatimonadetes bacterium]|nr:peptidylprolyl isomerase [Gemmatimonadota bacterium]
MKKLLKEPLLHFLALGAVLFAIGILRGDAAQPSNNRIAITPGVVERLLEGFRLTWQRPPTEDEFRGLLQDYLKEEVLYREALVMGLDRDDQIIRRRMRQKLEFLTADLVESIEPTDEDLQAHLDANPNLYRQETRISFTQVFFQERPDAEQPRSSALSMLQYLRTTPDADPEVLGDPFMYPAAHRDMLERDLLSVFGEEFTAQIVELPVGEWSGPVTSAFGLHVARGDALESGRLSELHEVRNAVYRDLVSERVREAEQGYFEGLLSQYTVTMEWPDGMEPIEITGVVQ